ncbi:MAG: electron transfer flavoprotein subunit alpha/FixB family protein [bacterium]|nr:electron transfer flavoprotein subunit alpha/FixB family protein [bacterium]
MAKDILVIAEHRGGNLKKVTIEAIGAAKKLAVDLGGEVHVAVLGSGIQPTAKEISSYGVPVFVFDDSKLENYSYETYSQALVPFIENRGYKLFIMGATPTGRDLSATLSSRLKAPVATEVTGLKSENGTIVTTRPIFAGKVISTFAMDSDRAIVTIRPNTFELSEKADGGSVETVPATIGDLKAIVKEVVQKSAGRIELTEADIVVSGGRGIREQGNYKMIEDLAEAIGAAAGASRAIVDAGWVDHSNQVGQTGKTVSPKLYIAVGISGAIQHLAGMSTSKVIVAINTNPDAPIFKIADYGIVADALQTVPLMIEEFKKLS